MNKQYYFRNKIKILFLVNNISYFLSHRLSLASEIYKLGAEVHVAAPMNELKFKSKELEIFHLHSIYLDRSAMNPFRELRTIFSIFRLYYKLKPDLVHHLTIKPIIYGGFLCRIFRIRACVYAIPGTGYLFTKNTYKIRIIRYFVKKMYKGIFNYNKCKVIFQNSDDLNLFVKDRIINKEKAVLILGSGVDVNKFYPKCNFDDKIMILLASRMLWSKGIGDFVKAASILKNKFLDLVFVLVGDTDLGSPDHIPPHQLQKWADEKIIEWWGWRDNMIEIIQQARIVCLPSSYGEGIPRVLIESAACGKPIVTTDTPGCREIVVNNHNGFLIPIFAPNELAFAIEKLVINPELCLTMGNKGRQMVIDKFSIEHVNRATIEIYGCLLGNKFNNY